VLLHRSLEHVGVRFHPRVSRSVLEQRPRSVLPEASIEATEAAAGRDSPSLRIQSRKPTVAAKTEVLLAEAQSALGSLRASGDVAFAFHVF